MLAVITEPAAVIASLLGHLAKREARAPPTVARDKLSHPQQPRCQAHRRAAIARGPWLPGLSATCVGTGGQEGVKRRLVQKSWAPASHATAE